MLPVDRQTDGDSLLLYLLQLLGNTHACVNPLPALRVLCLIVFQEVTSGELGANEACQRWIWNNVRATLLAQKKAIVCNNYSRQLNETSRRLGAAQCDMKEAETSLSDDELQSEDLLIL